MRWKNQLLQLQFWGFELETAVQAFQYNRQQCREKRLLIKSRYLMYTCLIVVRWKFQRHDKVIEIQVNELRNSNTFDVIWKKVLLQFHFFTFINLYFDIAWLFYIFWLCANTCIASPPISRGASQRVTQIELTKNSLGDEIANVNILYDDIVHAVQNTIDSCINSATDRRGYVLELIYDFLLVINTNLASILHLFQVMADYWSNFR